MAWHLRYTSAAAGPTGRSGFQFVTVTPGAPNELAGTVAPYMTYRPPPSAPLAPAPDELDQFPVALAYDRVGEHGLLVSCRYTGRDYSGRYGNFLGHAVVATGAEMEGLRPIEFWRSQMWADGEPDDLVPGDVLDPELLAEWLAGRDDDELLATLVDAVGAALHNGHGRIVLISEDIELIARWIAVVSYSLPLRLAAQLSFVTYAADPDAAPQYLVGTTPDSWTPSPGETCFRLDEPFPPDRGGSAFDPDAFDSTGLDRPGARGPESPRPQGPGSGAYGSGARGSARYGSGTSGSGTSGATPHGPHGSGPGPHGPGDSDPASHRPDATGPASYRTGHAGPGPYEPDTSGPTHDEPGDSGPASYRTGHAAPGPYEPDTSGPTYDRPGDPGPASYRSGDSGSAPQESDTSGSASYRSGDSGPTPYGADDTDAAPYRSGRSAPAPYEPDTSGPTYDRPGDSDPASHRPGGPGSAAYQPGSGRAPHRPDDSSPASYRPEGPDPYRPSGSGPVPYGSGGSSGSGRFGRLIADRWRAGDLGGIDEIGELAALAGDLRTAAALASLCAGDDTVSEAEESTVAALVRDAGDAVPGWVWHGLLATVPRLRVELAAALWEAAADPELTDRCAERCVELTLADPDRLDQLPIGLRCPDGMSPAFQAAVVNADDLVTLARITVLADRFGGALDPGTVTTAAADLAQGVSHDPGHSPTPGRAAGRDPGTSDHGSDRSAGRDPRDPLTSGTGTGSDPRASDRGTDRDPHDPRTSGTGTGSDPRASDRGTDRDPHDPRTSGTGTGSDPRASDRGTGRDPHDRRTPDRETGRDPYDSPTSGTGTASDPRASDRWADRDPHDPRTPVPGTGRDPYDPPTSGTGSDPRASDHNPHNPRTPDRDTHDSAASGRGTGRHARDSAASGTTGQGTNREARRSRLFGTAGRRETGAPKDPKSPRQSSRPGEAARQALEVVADPWREAFSTGVMNGLVEADRLEDLWDGLPKPGECARLIRRLRADQLGATHRVILAAFGPVPVDDPETIGLAELVVGSPSFVDSEARDVAELVLDHERALRANEPVQVARLLASIAGSEAGAGVVREFGSGGFSSISAELSRRGPRAQADVAAAAEPPVRARLIRDWLATGDRADLAELAVRLHWSGALDPLLDDWASDLAGKRFGRRHLQATLADRDPRLADGWRELAEDRRRGEG